MANCLWNDFEGNRKIHLANWKLVCMKKEFGGLGIPNLQEVNLCLLGSWVKRYIEGDGKIWKTFIDKKYFPQRRVNVFVPSSNPKISIFWKGVSSTIRALKFGYRWNVGDGKKVRLWEDTWFGVSPLSVQFWPIYTICNQQGITLADAWDGVHIKITFRRTFSNKLMEQWFQFEEVIKSVAFNSDPDTLVWQLENKGQYSTSSLYHVINFRGIQQIYPLVVWKIRIPPKIHVFLCLQSNNKIMTRDNLQKR